MIEKVLIYLLSLLLFVGCKKDENTPEPDSSLKSIYENLTENGNYTLFLEGVKIAGFEHLLKEKKEAVFVPNDEAFRRYMTKKRITSLQNFQADSLKMLIGYHLLNFLSNPDDFSAFTQATDAENSGICYKYKTFSQAKPKDVIDSKTGRTVKVYQLAKYLPVISTNLLREQKSSNYEADYKMFFPSIKWQGNQNKLYVANAAVIGERITAKNGYIFQIDEVVEPSLTTVYDALATQRTGASFNTFRELYDRFANMEYDSWHTRNNKEGNDSLFNFYHYLSPTTSDDLSDIAYEWTNAEQETDAEAHLRYAFNCFAPTDQVLVPYMQNFFEVQDVESVPMLNIYYFLKTHCAERSTLVLPSLIDGERWALERNNLLVSQFCSNGVFYGVDKVLEPAEFSMVTSPLFKYPRFRTMLNVGHKQDVFKELTDQDGEYTIFVIADWYLQDNYGYVVNYYGNPGSNDVINERVTIEKWKSEMDHTMVKMTANEQKEFINGQIINGYLDKDFHNKRVFYPTKNPYHFVYTEYGGIYSENHTGINEVNTWTYTYPNGSGKGIVHEIADKFDVSEDNVAAVLSQNYPKFHAALQDAELLGLLDGKRFMVFAPTDDVWDDTKLPTDVQKRANFLKYFFVPVAENNLTNYTLPEFGKTGEFETCCTNSSNVKAKMTILFANDKQLKVKNSAGTETLTDKSVPYFATDGLVFGLTSFVTPE